MYFKHELVRHEKSIDLSDTFKFDELPETGLSSGLIIWIHTPLTSGAHYGYDGKTRIVDYIDKVQLITDGKRPLRDLTGPQVQALNFWNTGEVAADHLSDPCIGPQYCQLVLPFGRRLYDNKFYLNWEDYSSVELDVTNSLTAALHTSADITIENVKLMDAEGIAPSEGVFQERSWREWATVQNATEYFKPPIGNKYRRIILQCEPAITTSAPYRRKRGFFHLAEEVKLAFKDYEETAFDGYGRYLLYRNASEWPHIPQTDGLLIASLDGSSHVNTGIGYRESSVVSKGEVATSLTEMNFGVYTYNDDLMVVYYDTGTNQYIFWSAKGFGYQNTLALLFNHIDEPEYYIDSNEKATINLDVKTENNANAAGGTNRIILSELVEK
ncbi:MAG: hypothetical protein ACE5OO_02425 [Candidatus Bathyarchaeia archaeon]